MRVGLWLATLFVVIHLGAFIRITRFVVPSTASVGSTVELDCAYDLQDDQLYDAKWYKDSDEFFRCKSDGQVQGFEVEGIKLHHEERATLGSCPVSMTILSNSSAGQYRCEVSTEAPEFKTTAHAVVMRVSNSIQPSKRVYNDGYDTTTPPRSGKSPAFIIYHYFYLVFIVSHTLYFLLQ